MRDFIYIRQPDTEEGRGVGVGYTGYVVCGNPPDWALSSVHFGFLTFCVN